MRHKNFILSLILSMGLAIFPNFADAQISVAEAFTGTLVVTTQEGEIDLYEAGDTLEAIAVGAYVEVFDGEFTISTDEGDQVTAVCLGHEVEVDGAADMTMQCGERDGLVKVVQGAVTLIDDEGISTQLKAGDQYRIQSLLEPVAAPTARAPFTPTPPGNPDSTDSRSIEASQF